MADKENKRRQYFIDKGFQAKFILKFCLVVIISSLLVGNIIFYLSRNSTTVAIENTKVTVKRTADFILPIMTQTLLIVTVFSVLVVLLLMLFISHKISGPLYRLRREIDALKEGDLGRNFNIRAKDQLQDLARSLNEMCASLSEKYRVFKKESGTLNDYLKQKNFSVSESEKGEVIKILERIDEALNFFKV